MLAGTKMLDTLNILDYQPIRRWIPRQPLKKLLEEYNCDAKTGNLLGWHCDKEEEEEEEKWKKKVKFSFLKVLLCGRGSSFIQARLILQ